MVLDRYRKPIIYTLRRGGWTLPSC